VPYLQEVSVKPNEEDLFKPLSAKTGRKAYAEAGPDKRAERGGQGRKWQAYLQRRKTDAARRAKGTLA
jgi:hypothetical protein